VKKTVSIIAGLVTLSALIVFGVYSFFFKTENTQSVVDATGGPISKGIDLPGDRNPVGGSSGDSSLSGVSSTTISQTSCSGGIQIERDDCVTKTALATRNPKLCNEIEGVIARSYCVIGATTKQSVQIQSLVPYVSSQNNSAQTNSKSTDAPDTAKSLAVALDNFVQTSIGQLDTTICSCSV
jgi:hypothetical protein